jgi:hypothetical protein
MSDNALYWLFQQDGMPLLRRANLTPGTMDRPGALRA